MFYVVQHAPTDPETGSIRPTLFLARGVSNSGKSTWARQWVAEDPENRRRVNRDEIRLALFNTPVCTFEQEQIITMAQQAAVRQHLVDGKDVLVDDTNLEKKFLLAWLLFAVEMKAGLSIKEFSVSYEEALRRNARRAETGGIDVPEYAIRRMFKRHTSEGVLNSMEGLVVDKYAERRRAREQTVSQPYVMVQGLPDAIVVDVDGTLTTGIHPDRGPFEWAQVGLDEPREHTIELVRMFHAAGNRVLIFSGRSEECKVETSLWLDQHGVPYDELHMRQVDDMAPDDLVKAELFEAVIRGRYNVKAVLDDRGSVVRLWHALGLPLLRVGDPFADF